MLDFEAEIIKAITWRSYDYLDRLAQNEISEWGWSCLRKILLTKTTKIENARLRDGLLHILGFTSVRGIDLDPAKVIKNKEVGAESLQEIRNQSLSIGTRVLGEMLEKKNTHFLDPEKMAVGSFAVFVPDVLETRKQEVLDLASNASLRDIIQTAYGFSIFTTGGVLTHRNSASYQKLSKALENITQGFGKDLEISSSTLRLGSTISGFDNCSPEVQKLLWHVLRFKTYKGKQIVRKSAKYIEQHADSRIASILHEYLSRTKYYYTAVKIVRTLGKIGLSESLVHILPILEKGGNWTSSAFRAIGSLAGENVTDYLIERFVNNSGRYRYRIIQAMRSRPPIEIAKHLDVLKEKTSGWERRRVDNLEVSVQKAIAKQVVLQT